ncbi:MAG: hypothetical protein H7124_07075 [Phycisphaerales bacterium]|nr:hypothetical protein [Hyphomonadaceae bacterium]
MASKVISHRKPRRKRGGWWAYFARRFAALAVTLAALGAASWFGQPPEPPFLPELVETRTSGPGPDAMLFEVDIALDLAGAPPPPERRIRRARGAAPNASAIAEPDGFEILSAPELAAISQARE